MTMETRYSTEHPGISIPDYIINSLDKRGFIDTSWHNDAMPSFHSEEHLLTVWIDYQYEDSESSHWLERKSWCKYAVYYTDEEGMSLDEEESAYTNDWQEILEFVDKTINPNEFIR